MDFDANTTSLRPELADREGGAGYQWILLYTMANSGNGLPLYRKVIFGSGHLLMVMAVAMWFSYSVVFFQNVLELPAKSTGTVILVAQVFGALSLPFAGTWSDRCHCPSYGRRKIFHLFSSVAVSCALFFLWHDCIGCQGVDNIYLVIYYSSWAALFQFGGIMQLSQLALIPELAQCDKKQMVELTSIRSVGCRCLGLFWNLASCALLPWVCVTTWVCVATWVCVYVYIVH